MSPFLFIAGKNKFISFLEEDWINMHIDWILGTISGSFETVPIVVKFCYYWDTLGFKMPFQFLNMLRISHYSIIFNHIWLICSRVHAINRFFNSVEVSHFIQYHLTVYLQNFFSFVHFLQCSSSSNLFWKKRWIFISNISFFPMLPWKTYFCSNN